MLSCVCYSTPPLPDGWRQTAVKMGEVAASCIIEGIEEKIDLEQMKIDRPDSPYTVRRGLLQAAWNLELDTDRSLIELCACDGQSHFSTFFRWTQWTPSYCFHSVEFPSSVEGLGRRTFRAWRKEIYSQVASTIKKSVKTWAAGRGLRMYARDELTHGHRRTQSIKLPYRIERNRSTAQFDNKSSLS